MTYFQASLNVALERYIIFLTKQWCKAFKGGTDLWKKMARGDCLLILP